ncbi:hypothetical protein Q4508_00110 [Amphritea sp. 2_MG-2023]|uniref:hypothetical protein n=1 Tax=Amphritea TaxID=515417 RepID=UPI001C073067|nr:MULTISPECIES: hypothetical protein [Amphritea]MBU2967726.1 hypothetical protein [Amphritea atlantica]MDO6416956.1 hypothetical protein [Amphritea sp. 2_MG-2023]
MGNKRHSSRKVGEAVCDMQGDLWDLDGIFLISMKQLVPGWSGGTLPSEIMPELKNTGKFHAHGFLLTAEPVAGGKIGLRICVFDD